MQLSQYLEDRNMKPKAFAEIIGVHRSSIVRFCDGTRLPDLDTIKRIHDATAGAVRAEDFFDNIEKARRPKAKPRPRKARASA